jgi:predicted Rossmann-fold nucleotide-binding protein
MPEEYSKEQIAELEKSRAISDAELLREGAEYLIDDQGNKTLIVPKHSIRTARVKRNREVKSPEKMISKEAEKGQWKDWTVAVMSASSNTNYAAMENTYGIGKLVAELGFDAINGGYSVGGMKRYADGFREKCREMGISDEEITDHLKGVIYSEQAIGQHLKKQRGVNEQATIYEADNLGERAGGIVYRADAIVAVEGGVGTELETLLASQGEWFVETYNDGITKEIKKLEEAGQLTEAKRKEILGQKRNIRPIISIDSTDMFVDMCRIAEERSPGTVNTLAEYTYIFESHSRTDRQDPKQPMATVDNDKKMQEQLAMILEMHYLMDLKEKASAEQTARLEELRHLLRDQDSDWRVRTLRDVIAEDKEKYNFSQGGGI